MKGFFEHEYLHYKKSHLKNLVALARADDHLHDAEIDFLYKIGGKYGLKKKHITKILDEQDNLVPEIPSDYDSRLDQLHDLVSMMLADGVVELVELEFCDDMAKKLGFRTELIHQLIDFIKSGRKSAGEWKQFKENAASYISDGI